ncbi:MAG: heat shock protein transcriptional repressor HspR [Ancrocorticia populi]|uniref:heat shock protein transcriptional repressor HspR n=1 Tax=Ancrocorticia populi TaxID=2175228 RepID=UPI003F91D3D6
MAIAGRDAAILTVSVAAELAGMHPQTVRQYDRMGLVPAKRTRGGGRRYSLADVDKLVTIQELSQNEGINLVGISRIFALQRENDQLRQQNSRLRKRAKNLQERVDQRKMLDQRVFAADVDGDVTLFARAAELRERLAGAGGRTAGWAGTASGDSGAGANGHSGEDTATDRGRDIIFPRTAEIVIWRPR